MKINNENNDDSQLAIAAAVGETNRLLVSLSTPFNSLSQNYIMSLSQITLNLYALLLLLPLINTNTPSHFVPTTCIICFVIIYQLI